MIRLTAKDIVRRARQLADLENSDFISWNENIHLLNESYQQLYQQVINHGDKYYLRSFDVAPAHYVNEPVRYVLPDDFYQLQAVQDAQTCRAVLRRSVNQSPRDLSYDIEGGELVIYGASIHPLKVSYYPVPHTLAYPADDVSLYIPSDIGGVFDLYGKKLAYATNTAIVSKCTVTVRDLETGEESSFVSGVTAKKLVAGRNGIAAGNILYSWQGTARLRGVSAVVTDADKNLYGFKDGAIYSIAGRIVYATDLPSISCGTLYDGRFFYAASDGAVYEYLPDGDDVPISTEKTGLLYMICDGELYMLDGGGALYRAGGVEVALSDEAVAVNGLDDETGYGFTCMEAGEYVMRSFVSDTSLDYPNSLFVQVLAYMLAMAYKAKQNADATALSMLYENALAQYYDSMGQDDYGAVRIQNVY